MSKTIVYERDLLYPADNILEPGSIHIEMLSPNKKGYIPVLIESKTNHSLEENIDSIIRTIQTDVFDRINVDIRKNVSLYIKLGPETKKKYGNKAYAAICCERDGKFDFKGVDEIED